MSYKSVNETRIFNIPIARELMSRLVANPSKSSQYEKLVSHDGTELNEGFHHITELGNDRDVYNMPFLVREDHTPWNEANSYLCHLIEHQSSNYRPTDKIRRIASSLLQYKVFTETEGIDYLDFKGKRLSQRPTARYYTYLKNNLGYKPRVLNIHTQSVYDFLVYISENWPEHCVDEKRIDNIRSVSMWYQAANGHRIQTTYNQRRLSSKTGRPSNPPLQTVRDEGEDLRPLSLKQFKDLRIALELNKWSTQERLIIQTAYKAGARKQSILTIRLGDIKSWYNSDIGNTGTIEVKVGPGTNIDTKNDMPLTLYFPKALVESLYTYAQSETANKRRIKFKENFTKTHPNLEVMDEDNIYLFLSDQGNCYYMAKDDPRYKYIKSTPKGQVSKNFQNKIQRLTPNTFPADFTFHWLRATFGYLLYVAIKKKIKILTDNGVLHENEVTDSDIITIIQNRMGHRDRTTTESYLKLFKNVDVRLKIQEIFEDTFINIEVDSLILEFPQ